MPTPSAISEASPAQSGRPVMLRKNGELVTTTTSPPSKSQSGNIPYHLADSYLSHAGRVYVNRLQGYHDRRQTMRANAAEVLIRRRSRKRKHPEQSGATEYLKRNTASLSAGPRNQGRKRGLKTAWEQNSRNGFPMLFEWLVGPNKSVCFTLRYHSETSSAFRRVAVV